MSHGKMSLDTQYNKDWMLHNCQINLRKVEASHGESRGVIGEHGEARVVEEMHILQSVSPYVILWDIEELTLLKITLLGKK